jgi:hypothetical protein
VGESLKWCLKLGRGSLKLVGESLKWCLKLGRGSLKLVGESLKWSLKGCLKFGGVTKGVANISGSRYLKKII